MNAITTAAEIKNTPENNIWKALAKCISLNRVPIIKNTTPAIKTYPAILLLSFTRFISFSNKMEIKININYLLKCYILLMKNKIHAFFIYVKGHVTEFLNRPSGG